MSLSFLFFPFFFYDRRNFENQSFFVVACLEVVKRRKIPVNGTIDTPKESLMRFRACKGEIPPPSGGVVKIPARPTFTRIQVFLKHPIPGG